MTAILSTMPPRRPSASAGPFSAISSTGRICRADELGGSPRPAVPVAPIQRSFGYIRCPELPQAPGVRVGRPEVGDQQPATRLEHAERLVDRLAPAIRVGDVVDRQGAEDDVEAASLERYSGHIAGDQLHPTRN